MSQLTQQAPFPGVFYCRPSPDSDPFVEPGSSVDANTTIGLLEVMKQFVEVKAEAAGKVLEVLAGDEQLLEAGDDILVIDTSGEGA
ncbi:acetyl-CoA carboxylase [Halomonas binhaiensis]|uniref:Biotin carboxyl carrier protein of acetyl-CoA carboxylase n=1 Tax=Halomonas binhaiensis TaxID=2562282 RepID=A0A5C1NDA0_9GAMM|nr:acetyl-CoA carboxylase [Halomonas binhaiensis]QEM81276.1 biotin carboxyl carrier domain-containing protein [Halomonas binhaiensis]